MEKLTKKNIELRFWTSNKFISSSNKINNKRNNKINRHIPSLEHIFYNKQMYTDTHTHYTQSILLSSTCVWKNFDFVFVSIRILCRFIEVEAFQTKLDFNLIGQFINWYFKNCGEIRLFVCGNISLKFLALRNASCRKDHLYLGNIEIDQWIVSHIMLSSNKKSIEKLNYFGKLGKNGTGSWQDKSPNWPGQYFFYPWAPVWKLFCSSTLRYISISMLATYSVQ